MTKYSAGITLALLAAACSSEPADDEVVERDTTIRTDAPAGTSRGVSELTATTADKEINRLADQTPTGTGGDTASSGAAELARIPREFRGTWAWSQSDCNMANHYRISVSSEKVRFFEGGGEATDIRRNGNALAVTYPERQPSDEVRDEVVYFALEGSGSTMRVRQGDYRSFRYIKCGSGGSQSGGDATSSVATVPPRFRGLYAPDRRACEQDYNYAPAFQNVHVMAERASFFETGGPVLNISVDGNTITINMREYVGDGSSERDIYLALEGDDLARYKRGQSQPSQHYVRCSG